MLPISEDTSDLVFRVLFSTIFVGLGFEHLLSDDLLQALMPGWIGPKRLLSLASGAVLLTGGLSIMLGIKTHLGASVLIVFLVAVTALVHGPGLFGYPDDMPEDWQWIWQVYQRSNFVKNICLIGVCVHLITHQTGRYSLDYYLQTRHRASSALL
ncbi:MAG: DoxX family protein [Proteobacteria bacterium]|nr:DoxX family protein [Pseudomonadota bacterium]